MLEKLPGIEYKKLESVATAGEIFQYDDVWEKARISKPMKLPTFNPAVNIN